MTTAATPAFTPAYCTTYTDTRSGQNLRQLDEAAEKLLAEALSSPVITEGQRLKAWEKFFATEDWSKRLAMGGVISKYTRAVLKGERQPRPDVVPAVTPEQVAAVAVEAEAEASFAAEQPEMVAQPVVEVVAEVTPAVAQVEPVVAEATEVPMWVETAIREALPAGVAWSGEQLPGVGETVVAVRQGRPRRVTVAGYFHAEGFMGIVAEFKGKVPSGLAGCPRSRCFFGSEVKEVKAAA